MAKDYSLSVAAAMWRYAENCADKERRNTIMTTETDGGLIADKSPDDWRIVYMPEADIDKASGVCSVMRNRWFMVHPERGLLFYQSIHRRKGQLRGASAQCNADKAVVEHLRQKLWPWAELRFYERVIVPIDLGDYL